MEYCIYEIGQGCETLVLYMTEYSTDRVEGVLSTLHQNYYPQLCKLDDEEMEKIEIVAVGAVLGDEFDHNSKLKVMKFREVMNGPDSNKWKEEIKNEHK